jgi:hypothetical protein
MGSVSFLEMIGVKLSKECKDVDKEKLYEVGWRGGKGGGRAIFFWECGTS